MLKESEEISLLKKVEQHFGSEWIRNFYSNPVFVVSAPRSGSTLLFELLTKAPDVWSVGGESHGIFQIFPHLEAENPAFDSGRLTEAHADDETSRLFRAAFLYLLQDRKERRYINLTLPDRPRNVCFLEKTPRNSLNIPFLLKVFPNARFIFLYRDAKQNIGSIIDAWAIGKEKGTFVTFRNLPNWDRDHWCLLLPPGWRELKGKPTADIAAFQWRSANEAILDELEKLPRERWIALSYANLTAAPETEIRSLCTFSQAGFDNQLKQLVSKDLEMSESSVSPPDPNKWKRHEQGILAALPSCQAVIDRLNSLKNG